MGRMPELIWAGAFVCVAIAAVDASHAAGLLDRERRLVQVFHLGSV